MKILIIEDEPKVVDFIKRGLEENGYLTDVAFDGQIGEKLAKRNFYDLILLDVILPFINGFEVCRRIRESKPDVPVLMLTALGTTEDKVSGFDSGADDYLVKPFEFRELLARIKSLTKRNNGVIRSSNVIRVDDLELDIEKKHAVRKGKKIELTAKEFLLLEYLMINKGRVLSRENASVRKLKKHVEELEALKEKLNKDLSELKLVADNLRYENEKLNGLLASVQKDNEALEFNNSVLRAMTADNYRIEALKGKNEKLTVNAKRTNKLFVTMDIPSSSDHGLYFKVVTPEGEEYSSKTDISANIKVIDTQDLVANTDTDISNLSSGKKRIEMSCKPAKKLKKGVYQFNIYNEKTYIGSTQLRLK